MLKTERIKCLCWNFTDNYTFNGNEWTKLILHYLEADEIEINFHNETRLYISPINEIEFRNFSSFQYMNYVYS